jgi:glutamate carboxypeptidase
MSRILNAFYEQVRGEEYLTFNPGTLLGGTFVDYDKQTSSGEVFGKTNVVAQTAVANGGLRFISEEQKESARSKMRDIVNQNLPQTSAIITFQDSYPAMGPSKGNIAVLKVLSEVSQDLGYGPVSGYDPSKRGAADISFVADYVDGLDGLGTMGNYAHTPQETVNLKTMNALIQRAALLIYRLTR